MRSGGARPLWITVAVAAGLLATVLALQWARHAYSAELSGADEPAHFITALLIRDYLHAGVPASPIAYAENYYLHYPKVAFGMWPPVFHAVAAAWMLVLPATVASVRVLIAVIVAMAGLLAFRLTKDDAGTIPAALLAAAFVVSPQVQLSSQQVMVDGLVAALVFASALAWRRFVASGATRDALLVGLLGSAAMLTKGNGTAALGLPFAWVLVANRWDVLRWRGTWYAVGGMLLAGGPWQVYSWRLLSRTVVREGASGTLLDRGAVYAGYLAQAVGPLVAAAALAGAVLVARRLVRREMPEAWTTPIALLLTVLGFHIVLPQPPNIRYLIPALPVVLWLAWLAVRTAAHAFTGGGRLVVGAVLAAALCGDMAVRAVRLEPRRHHGIGAIAGWLATRPAGVVLVSDGDPGVNTSGMVIVEVAVRDTRPGRVVLRANKTLSSSSWDGQERQLHRATPEAVLAFLAQVPVRYVVLDDGPDGREPEPANEILRAALKASEHWRLAGTFPDAANPRHRRLVYEAATEPGGAGAVSIDLGRTLGRTLTLPSRP